MINSLIYNNSGHYGGGVCCQSNGLSITNTTVTKNSATMGGGIIISVSDPEITNSIIANNESYGFGNELCFSSSVSKKSNPTIQYCNFGKENSGDFHSDVPLEENIPYFLQIVTNNINGDDCDPYYNIQETPLFSENANDYHLQQNSSCIDAGSNSFISLDYDLENNLRILKGNIDSVVDIGCYEYNSTIVGLFYYENTYKEIIDIFPNPVIDYLHIKVDSNFCIHSIEIIDSKGRKIKSLNVNNRCYIFNIRDITNGIYFIKINTNRETIVRKIVKN